MIAAPGSFAGMGQGVQRDVARSQRELIAAQKFASGLPKESRPGDALRNAPRVLPLNVPPSEYDGCAVRGIGPVQPVQVSSDQQSVIMPPPAPTDTNLLLPQNTGMVNVQPAPPPASVYVPGSGTWGPPLPEQRQTKFYSIVHNPGLGTTWGDSTRYPVSVNGNGGMSGKSLLLLGLGALGLYAVTRKKGRR